MTADEMFEELGYFKREEDDEIYFVNGELDCIIEFDITRQFVAIGDEHYRQQYFSLKELKAINKKVEELGW